MENVLVTVILPVYNGGKYLRAALQSVLAQTTENFELIIIDDGSTDETPNIIRNACCVDSRIIPVTKKNAGKASAMYQGVLRSRGTWIAQIDSDDVWCPDRLSRMLELADGVDVISDDLVVCDRELRCGRSYLALQGARQATASMRISFERFVAKDLGMLKPIIKRSFLTEHNLNFQPDRHRTYDFHFGAVLLLANARWLQMSDAYYLYRVHAHNKSSDALAVSRGVVASVDDLLKRYQGLSRRELRLLYRRRRVWRCNLAWAEWRCDSNTRGRVRSIAKLVGAPSRMLCVAGKCVYALRRHITRLRARSRLIILRRTG